jgi:hypothetical protein
MRLQPRPAVVWGPYSTTANGKFRILKRISYHELPEASRHYAYMKNTGWTIGVPGFDSRQGLGIFLFSNVYRPALGPTQAPTQWVSGALSVEVKRPGREADHSPPSTVEVNECVDLYLHSLVRLHGVMLS